LIFIEASQGSGFLGEGPHKSKAFDRRELRPVGSIDRVLVAGSRKLPYFHFRDPARSRAVVNIGGISNVTWMPPGMKTVGFDCGPGNVLLDGWARRHLGAHFDEDGRWASRGQTDAALLQRLLAELVNRQAFLRIFDLTSVASPEAF